MLISMLIYTFGPSMIAILVAMAGGAAWSGRGAPLLMIFEFYLLIQLVIRKQSIGYVSQ